MNLFSTKLFNVNYSKSYEKIVFSILLLITLLMKEMNTYRTTAKVVGIIYLAGMVVGIGGNILIQSMLGTPDYLSSISTNGQTYDIIFDTTVKSPFSGCVKSLKQKGIDLRSVHMSLSAIVRGPVEVTNYIQKPVITISVFYGSG